MSDKLPDGWELLKIEDVCESIIAGGDVPKNSFSKTKSDINNIPIYSNGIDNSGLYGYTNIAVVSKPCVTITARGTIGHIELRKEPFYPIIRLICCIPNENTNVKYLNYVLKHIVIVGEGTSIPQLTIPTIKELTIPIPPLSEQERIVKIIETKFKAVEKARLASNEQVKTLELLTSTYIQEIFNSIDNSNFIKLKELCLIERGGSPRPIDQFLTKDENGINWIKIGDTKNSSKYIESTAEKIIPEGAKHSRKVKKGDFILSNSMSFGRPYILNIDGCIHDGWLVLSNFSDKLDKDYLYYVLSSEFVKNHFINEARGAIVKNLNIDIVKDVSIPLPDVNKQKEIVKALEKRNTQVDKMKSLLHDQLTNINALPQSILRQAFQGKL